jgi:hypothetical protein
MLPHNDGFPLVTAAFIQDRNSKRSPAATRVQMELACTKKLKANKFWTSKKFRENAACGLLDLTESPIAEIICQCCF